MHWNKIRQYLSDHTYARDNGTKHYYMGMILREIVDYLEERDKVDGEELNKKRYEEIARQYLEESNEEQDKVEEDPVEKSFEEIAWNLDNHLKEVNTDFQFGDLVRYENGDYVVQGFVNRRFGDNSVVDRHGLLTLRLHIDEDEEDELDVLAVKCRVIRRGK